MIIQKIKRILCLIYVTIDLEDTNPTAKIVSFATKSMVVIAILSYIISTTPAAR